MALANVVPGLVAEIYRQYRTGERAAARELNADLVDLNQAVTARHGIPGLKAAMRHRGAPAGHVRFPHLPVDDDVASEVHSLVDEALDR